MILTDYYKFAKVANKSATRLDCVASTKSYPYFEDKRSSKSTSATAKRDAIQAGDLVIYTQDRPSIYRQTDKLAEKMIAIKGKHITSIYTPNPFNCIGYGDIKDTADAVIFVMDMQIINGKIQNLSSLEMFIARGQAKNKKGVYTAYFNGALSEEIRLLKEGAKIEK